MNCKYHPNKKASNTCSICGEWLCEDCVLDINGRIYCKDCLRKNINENEIVSHKKEIRKKSSILTLIFSFMPGCAQMYLGLIKRGILILLSFLVSIIYLETPILAITIFIVSFFDGFRIKDKLNSGIYLEDNLNDIKNFIFENKGFLLILLAIVIIPAIFDNIEDFFEDFFEHNIFHSLNILRYNLLDILTIFISGLIVIIPVVCITAIILEKIKNNKNKKSID